MSDLKHTQRGFAYIEFQDRYDHKCSIQKSSLATEDAIWFGIDDANPQVLHGDAHRLGIETDATSGWVPYPLPAEVSLATRMHLTQDQVRELLPTLIHFAETGDVLAPADCRTQPEATAPAQAAKTVPVLNERGKFDPYDTRISTEPVFAEITVPRDQPTDFDRELAAFEAWFALDPTDYGLKEIIKRGWFARAALASSANALSAGGVGWMRWQLKWQKATRAGLSCQPWTIAAA